MDKKGKRSHHNQKDVGNIKIEDYVRINKEINKSLSAKSLQIVNLENLLRMAETEKHSLQMECHTWKSKFVQIRKLYIEHVHGLQTITNQLRANAPNINIVSASCRESNSIESIRNRSGRSNVECEFVRNYY